MSLNTLIIKKEGKLNDWTCEFVDMLNYPNIIIDGELCWFYNRYKQLREELLIEEITKEEVKDDR